MTRANQFLRRWKHPMAVHIPTFLDVAGATLLSVGANMIYAPAGWIVGGMAVLAINRSVHGD